MPYSLIRLLPGSPPGSRTSILAGKAATETLIRLHEMPMVVVYPWGVPPVNSPTVRA